MCTVLSHFDISLFRYFGTLTFLRLKRCFFNKIKTKCFENISELTQKQIITLIRLNYYRNKENMYFFWFQDDSALDETSLTGTTFWMTAKFYNAEDGSIMDFVKSDIGSSEVNETNDMYYKVVIDKTNYSYQVFRYNNKF